MEANVERTSVWIDKELVKKAKTISSHEDTTLADVIETALRPVIEKRYRRMADKMAAELGEAGA